MPKQKIPAGGFQASQSGGLHASSIGADYPWSVQPAVVRGRFVWIFTNCLTGYRSRPFNVYDVAHANMLQHRNIVERANRDAKAGRTMEHVRR